MKGFDRFLLFITSVITALSAAFLSLLVLDWVPNFDLGLWLMQVQHTSWAFVTTLVISLFMFLLAVRFLILSIRNAGKVPPSVDQRNDLGDIRISMETVRNLALKSIARIRGAQDIKVRVHMNQAGLEIMVRVFVDGERSISEITEEIQQSVKEYIEELTGIPVASVSVFVANLIHAPTVRNRVE